jgi:hypothetical protein
MADDLHDFLEEQNGSEDHVEGNTLLGKTKPRAW